MSVEILLESNRSLDEFCFVLRGVVVEIVWLICGMNETVISFSLFSESTMQYKKLPTLNEYKAAGRRRSRERKRISEDL